MTTHRGRKGQWTLSSWLAAFVLLAAFGLPRTAHGAVCGGAFDILQKGFCSTTTNQGCLSAVDCPAGETCKTFDFFDPGDPKGNGGNQLRVNLALGAGSITTGTPPQLTVSRVRFDLDCVANSGFPCTDQGNVVQYAGDATITTTCLGVTWTSSTAQGGNEIVFNASQPIVIAQNCSPRGAGGCGNCELEFTIRVQGQEPSGSDATPQVVEEVAGYVNGAGDATCSATLQSGASQTADLPICPSCTVDECNLGCDQTTGTCTPQSASTPCTDTDNNTCTTAGCEVNASGVGVCVQTHTFASDSTPCSDTDGDACTTAGCNGQGVCDQNHMTKTCPGADECNGGCDKTSGQCTPKVSTPCTDTDGNICTIAGCELSPTNPDLGVCAQNHMFEHDSVPCPDTDGNACTTAGCNGAGVCDQTHASKTCPPTDECNGGCDTTSGQCTPKVSTPCTDTDSNACTLAGCEVSGTNPDLGVCVQTHMFASDSTPCTDTDGQTCTTAGCNGQGVCDQTHQQNCQQCPNAFTGLNLGAASNFAVLGLNGADLTISEGATKIVGDVGAGPHNTGDLLKSTVVGDLILDPTAHLDIHSDFKVTGSTTVMDLTQADADARAASMDAAGMTPTQTFGNINGSTTFTGNGSLNVISIQSVNLVKQTLRISGNASEIFIFNVSGAFIFNGSQMVLSGGVTANHILWNFPTAGSDIEFFKPVAVAFGTFLAPQRGFIQDHGDLEGAAIAGGTLKFHSAALVNFCPQP